MARKKVLLRYIENAAARKASFKKRRQGLLKKVEEVSILCDVLACVIVYSEYPNEPPVHWPENRADVEQVLLKFQSCPDIERRKKMVTQESYLRERIEKFTEQLRRLRRSNHEMDMYHLMQLIYLYGKNQGEFTTDELQSLRVFTEEKIKELERRAEFLIQTSNGPPTPTDEVRPPPQPPATQPPATQLSPPPPASSASTDFQGFVEMFRQRDQPSGSSSIKEEVPYPLPSKGSSRAGLVAASASRLPQGNFKVGGGSGARDEPDGNDGVIVGHGTLIPMGPTVAGGGRSGTYGMPLRNPNIDDASGGQGMAFPYVAGPGGNVGGYAVNPCQWSTFVGSNIGGPGFSAGQASSNGVVGSGHSDVGPYGVGVPHGGYVGEVPGVHNLMSGGAIGGEGYLVQAPPENIPVANTGSFVPALTGSDADNLSL